MTCGGSAMGKNIVLLSDGTGNSSAKLFKTNVWRLFQALDLTDPARQIAYYDDGVGTSSFKPLAILGGVFGVGLKRNIIDIYSFCCRNYAAGDSLYGFGFSRGAFTIRVTAGFIASIGLVAYDGNDAHLARDAQIAYRQYRKVRDRTRGNFLIGPLRWLRDWISHSIFRNPSFEEIQPSLVQIDKFDFLGVWDTVDAYGGPIEEITRAIDYWYWPLSMPDRFLNRKIIRACHALALEDERDAFRPVLWDDRYVRQGNKLTPLHHDWQPAPADPSKPLSALDSERISQVWFVGVHSDVGGGYPQDGLSYKTLDWMMERAEIYGLHYQPDQREWLKTFIGPYDKLNDSRHGLGGYYRYRPRRLEEIYSRPPYKLTLLEDIRYFLSILKGGKAPDMEVTKNLASGTRVVGRPAPKIHRSVLDRIAKGTDRYSPIVLPKTFDIVDDDGSITSNISTPVEADEAEARAIRQEEVWDWVWARRVTYFLTAFASFFLLILPLIEKWKPGRGPASIAEIIIPVVDAVAAFMPGFLGPWFDAIRASPGRFLGGALLVWFLLTLGGRMQGHIRDVMRGIWRNPTQSPTRPPGLVHAIRTSGLYQAFFYALKHWTLPTFFAAVIAVVVLFAVWSLLNRASFAYFDVVAGNVCAPSGDATARPVTPGGRTVTFNVRALCHPTGLLLERRKTYQVSFVMNDPWEDGHRYDESEPRKAMGILTDPKGFGFEKMTPWMWAGLPTRRLLASNWFVPILRIGNTGFDEIVPTLVREGPPGCQCGIRLTARFTAKRDGELFIYVNDTVVGWPGSFDKYYRNNKGTAEVTVSEVEN